MSRWEQSFDSSWLLKNLWMASCYTVRIKVFVSWFLLKFLDEKKVNGTILL